MALTTKFGTFECNVLPFGLCNRPSHFMRMMNWISRKFEQFMVVYLYDILIFSPTLKEHQEHVAVVLSSLKQEWLHLQGEKCYFAQRGIKVCAVWIDQGCIDTEQRKVSAVRDCTTPTRPREVKEFWWLTGFYWKFIHHYAHIAIPLYAGA